MKVRIAILSMILVSLLGTGCTAPSVTLVAPEAEPTTSPVVPDPSSSLFDPAGNFVLHISNQSFEMSPVDITVEIDGEEVISQDFEVGDQHQWKRFVLRLDPGTHRLVARSVRGEAVLERTFVVEGRHWAALSYWYYSAEDGNPPQPKVLTIDIEDKEIGFL